MSGPGGRSAATQLQAEAELLELLRASVYPGAASEALRLVLAYCQALGVDPLQKPVHLCRAIRRAAPRPGRCCPASACTARSPRAAAARAPASRNSALR